MEILEIINKLKYAGEKEKRKVLVQLMNDKKLLSKFVHTVKLSDDYQDKISLAIVAGYVQSKNLLGPLLGLIRDENKYVRQSVCDALGEMDFPEAKPYLTKIMYSDDSFLVWPRAAIALYKLGEKKKVIKMLKGNYNFENPVNTEPAVLEAINELELSLEKEDGIFSKSINKINKFFNK